MKRLTLVGRYDAGMLQSAMRICLARADLRRLRSLNGRRAAAAGGSFDVRPDGRSIGL